ncbi:hypothetical protein C8R44DRAFT_988358 [Mycena epipterygia]|nr:hypothetical protein C8R44DRAFT_988358 [Mycena epipterygia]
MVRFSIFRALLFSPAFRVNNLRLLLLVSSFTSVWLTVVLYSESSQSLIAQTALPLEPRSFFISVIRLAICSCSLIFLHHILITRNSLFGWRVHRLAVIDLAIVVIETCVMCYLIYWFAMEDLPLFDPGIWSFSIHVLLLLFSAAFRTATVIACNDKLFNQRFAFLGGCTRTRPPFTPLTILLNRSLARPLVRGESKPIIFIRAVILTCIGVGIPLFGIYAVIIRPVGAQVSTQMILGVPGHPGHVFQAPPGNATIGLPGLSYAGSRDSAVVSATLWSDEVIACPATSGSRDDNFVQCPVSWPDIATMSISVHFTGGMLQVYPIQGTLPAGLEYWELYLLGGGIPLFPGSNVIAALSWTERQLISKTLWWGFGSRSTVFISEITGLQTNAFSATTDANVTTLVLFQTSANAMKVLQDTADVTAISGIATFGGFWTFVNGTFALFFGANGGDPFLRWASYIYSNVARWFVNGMKTSRPYTQKGVNQALNLLESWPSSASALWIWTRIHGPLPTNRKVISKHRPKSRYQSPILSRFTEHIGFRKAEASASRWTSKLPVHIQKLIPSTVDILSKKYHCWIWI